MARIYTLVRGASLTDGILEIARKEAIATALVSAVGGVNRLTIAYFNSREKRYEEHPFEEFLEATGILGNITTKGGSPFLHCHGTFGRRDMSVIGGHIVSASVFPLMEVVLTPTSNKALRRFVTETGLNEIYATEEGGDGGK